MFSQTPGRCSGVPETVGVGEGGDLAGSGQTRQIGAVTEALQTIEEATALRMARAACYAFVTGPDHAKYWCDRPTSDFLSGDADDTILMARVVDAMRAA